MSILTYVYEYVPKLTLKLFVLMIIYIKTGDFSNMSINVSLLVCPLWKSTVSELPNLFMVIHLTVCTHPSNAWLFLLFIMFFVLQPRSTIRLMVWTEIFRQLLELCRSQRFACRVSETLALPLLMLIRNVTPLCGLIYMWRSRFRSPTAETDL